MSALEKKFDDKWYVTINHDQIEVSEACYRELAAKAFEQLKEEVHPGYFWNNHVLVPVK